MKKQSKGSGYGLNSIKARLIIIMVALSMIPIIITTIIAVRTMTNQALEDGEALNLRQAAVLEADFNGLIEQNISMLELLAGEDMTLNLIANPTDEALLSEVKHSLEQVDAVLADSNSTVLTGADGQNIVRSTGDLVNIAERGYFTTAMKGTVNISNPTVSKTTGKLICVIAVPVKDASGAVVGVLTRNYGVSILHDMLVEEAGEDQVMFMTDTDGIVIAHSAHEINSESEEDDRSASEFFTSTADTGTCISDEIGYKQVMSWNKDDITGWSIVVAREYDSMMSGAKRTTIIFIVIGVALALAAAAIALWMATSINKPIELLNDSLADLADGQFTEITKYTDRKDEFGTMVNETNTVIAKIKEVVSDLKNVMENLSESSTLLAESAGQISQTTDDVSEAVQEIAKGATDQADTIQRASENMGMLSDAIQEVANNAEGLATTASSMNDQSMSSANAMGDLADNMEAMSRAMDEISEGMNATNAAVQSVNDRVDGITSIASQTNLLALNASIEAARAGEAGRGFAVVAEEIGKLATESADTANEIRAEMETLLKQSQNAIQKTKEVTDISENVNAVLQNTVAQINELIGGVGTTVDGVTTISGLSQESAASKSIIVDAMDSLSAISEENAASTQQTSASMQELNATVNVLSQSASDLNELAKQLEEDLNFFKM